MCMRKRHVVIDEIYNSVKRYAFVIVVWFVFVRRGVLCM